MYFVFPLAIQHSNSLGGFSLPSFEMSIIYLECDGYFVMKVESGIADYTSGLGVLLESAKIAPSEAQLLRLSKTMLSRLISPWHNGLSISSQSKDFQVKYACRWWHHIYDAHLQGLNATREIGDRLKSVYLMEEPERVSSVDAVKDDEEENAEEEALTDDADVDEIETMWCS